MLCQEDGLAISSELYKERKARLELMLPVNYKSQAAFVELQTPASIGGTKLWNDGLSSHRLLPLAENNGQSVTLNAIERVLANPSRYPLLNTIAPSQEYLFYINVFQRTKSGKDTQDDFRILVESSV